MAYLEPLTCRHPILSIATSNYLEECRYTAEYQQKIDNDVCTITHILTGKKCLVKELVLEGKAVATCTVVAPWAMYRETFRATEIPVELQTGEVRIEQQVDLRTEEFESPLKMQPAIVIVDPPPPLVLGEEHGVDDIWHGAEITLEKGAVLTDHPWWETTLGNSILNVQKARDGELAIGSYEVSMSKDKDFYFEMKVSPELFNAMHHPGDSYAHVQSLYAAALAEGLIQLRDSYENSTEWRIYANLRSLHTHLKERGLPTWDDASDEDFRPNQIVAGLIPHVIDNSSAEKSEQE